MRTVADVMTRDVLVLRDDVRVEVAARLLADHGYAGAPVLEQHGRLAGVLHAVDVADVHLPPHTVEVRPVLVRDLARPAVIVAPTSPVHLAARRMRTHGTGRLVVVEHDRHVMGIVTASDLLRAVAGQGDLLRRTVDERIAALGLASVSADVEPPGMVLLSGTVGSWADRERIVREIGRIGGVTEVAGLIAIEPSEARDDAAAGSADASATDVHTGGPT